MNPKRSLLGGKRSADSRSEGIAALFEKQVKKWAMKPALVCSHRTYTYKELNEEADKIALCLAEKNLSLESIVGIIASRSDILVLSELGILKAGYAYLPLDPLLPEERLSFLIQDSNCKVVMYERDKRYEVPPGIECLDINEILEQTSVSPFVSVTCSGSSLAYVMYTSGTTGKPKGCLIEHKSIIRLVVDTDYIVITEADRICMASSPSFDASTLELWGALLNGAELHILNESILRSPNQLVSWLRCRGISIIFLTTALFNQLVMWDPQFAASLRVVLFGGGTADIDCVNHFAICNPKVQLINGYGPTENTTFSMTYQIQGVQQQDVPIGKPIANSQAYIYDREGCQCSVGQIGEICVAGEGLSRGYLNRPDLTALKFVQNPNMSGTLMYRTGDLGYWDKDGNIHFSGRSDNQVKLRGHRIELGEIENTLKQLRGICEVVVKTWGVGGDKYLCVYYTTARELSSNTIRIFLQERLPAYMIPSKCVWLEEMPLSWNGKVDRQALPMPSQVAASNRPSYEPPATDLERLLVAIWSEVLGPKADRVGVYDRFDEIGGNSLLAMQVMSRLLEHDYQIEMSTLAELLNIRELAEHCGRRTDSSWQEEIVGEAPLTLLQELTLRVQDPQIVSHYNIAAYRRLDTPIGAETLQDTYRRLITHHDGLRIVFVRSSVGISQQCLPVSDFPDGASVYDYRGEADPVTWIEEQSQALQTQFDLGRGPLFRLILFKTNDCDHLLILLHHLIADLYSVSIIMDDLTKLLNSKNDREKAKLPPKTESMLSLAKKQRLQIKDANVIDANVTAYSDNISYLGDMKYLTARLDEEISRGIILGIPHSKKGRTLEILLTALGYSWYDYTGREHLVTYLVQHNRQSSPNEGFNFRTVGWFASAHPYTIRIDPNKDILFNIQTTKNILRMDCLVQTIPIGQTETPIAFNHLGKMDDYSLVGASELVFNFGEIASPKLKVVEDYFLMTVLEKNGFVIVTLNYSNRSACEGDAKILLDSYCDTLRVFVNSLS